MDTEGTSQRLWTVQEDNLHPSLLLSVVDTVVVLRLCIQSGPSSGLCS